MLSSLLVAAAEASAPNTPSWSYSVALVMILCNLAVIAIGRFAIQNRGYGPDFPFSKPAILEGFGIPELLATTSLGHIVGAGVILGLGNAGLL